VPLLAPSRRRPHSLGRRSREAAGKRMNPGATAGLSTFFPEFPLLANSERLDHRTITIDVLRLEVIQEATALSYEHEQAASRVVILCVDLEVLGEIRDALRQERNLDFRRARITGLAGVFLYDRLFPFCCQGHGGCSDLLCFLSA